MFAVFTLKAKDKFNSIEPDGSMLNRINWFVSCSVGPSVLFLILKSGFSRTQELKKRVPGASN